jgi:hypothetical protein
LTPVSVSGSGPVARVVRAAFVAAALVCAAGAMHALAIGVSVHDPWLFPMLVVLPAAAAAGFALSLLRSAESRLNLAMLTVAIVTGLYALDAALALLPTRSDPTWEQAAQAQGRSFAQRSRFAVVEDLRAAGTTAYPSFGARGLRMLRGRQGGGVTIDGRVIAPLAQLANSVIVDCNEGGEFSVFRTDERGYNNPPGSWGHDVDLAAVGDSYIQGSCVEPTQTLVANLRKGVPNTVGLGLGDSGPLVMLGMIKEFLPAVHPANVYWFYYEGNDLRNLSAERQVKALRAYLEPDATQRLAELQDRIDGVLANYVEQALDAPAEDTDEPASGQDATVGLTGSIRRWLTLHRIRDALALANVRQRLGRCCETAFLGVVLAEAKRTVEAWGGHLHFVYLPAAGRYVHPLSAILDDDLRFRGQVLETARKVGLPIIDIDAAFRETGDPASLYFNARSHFNPAGYRVAARAVLRELGVELPADSAEMAGPIPGMAGGDSSPPARH